MDQRPTGDEGHRQSLGFGAAVRDSLFRPRRFFEALDPEGPLLPALGFALLFTFIASLGFALDDYLGVARGAAPDPLFPSTPWYWNLFDWPFILALELLYMSWFHLVLRWRKGAAFGLRASLRAYCYTGAVNLFSLIPFLGVWVVLLWGWWLIFLAFKTVQRTTWTRVITSWLIANALLGLLVFGLIFFAGYFRHYFA
ncbi:MAG: YIP1 family protein [bacterium]